MDKFTQKIKRILLQYLVIKEGCIIEQPLTRNENNAIIRDVFGFRYEITINLIGRTQEHRDDT